jgi:hypothetical protein
VKASPACTESLGHHRQDDPSTAGNNLPTPSASAPESERQMSPPPRPRVVQQRHRNQPPPTPKPRPVAKVSVCKDTGDAVKTSYNHARTLINTDLRDSSPPFGERRSQQGSSLSIPWHAIQDSCECLIRSIRVYPCPSVVKLFSP